MARGIGINRNIGMLLLGIWLVLFGASALIPFAVPGMLMAVLALLAGILILIGR